MDRERIERQLKMASLALADFEKQLDKEKVAPEARKKNAKWRQLEGDVRALKRRVLAVREIEEREAAAIERKNNQGAEAVEEAVAE